METTARVVELADTLDLGSSTVGVRVQIPPLALDLGGVSQYYATNVCESSSVVELHLAKVDVAGSSPVSRSLERPGNPGRFFIRYLL